MIKVKFETKQDYIDYCKNSEIMNYPRKCGSSYVYIENGNSCKDLIYFESGYIDIEPKSYPCILVHIDINDNIYGEFIYQNDFD